MRKNFTFRIVKGGAVAQYDSGIHYTIYNLPHIHFNAISVHCPLHCFRTDFYCDKTSLSANFDRDLCNCKYSTMLLRHKSSLQ